MHNKEYLIKNACYSVTKYYLCKQNNKRSLLGRKQRSQVVRSFPNRYQFSCTNKVTSLFSDRYIFIIILPCKTAAFGMQNNRFCNALVANKLHDRCTCEKYLRYYCSLFTHKMSYINSTSTVFSVVYTGSEAYLKYCYGSVNARWICIVLLFVAPLLQGFCCCLVWLL